MLLRLKKIWWCILRNRYVHWQYFLKDLPCEYGERLRRRFYTKYFGRVGKHLVIRQDVRIRNIQNIFIGDYSEIGEGVMLQGAGGIYIGDHVILGPHVKIWSANHRYDDINKPILEQWYDFKKVIIGDNVWLGANVFVMPGANIGDGVIVSAGSVVGGKAIPPYKIVAGNPARIIGTRGGAETKDIAPGAPTGFSAKDRESDNR